MNVTNKAEMHTFPCAEGHKNSRKHVLMQSALTGAGCGIPAHPGQWPLSVAAQKAEEKRASP